LPVPTYLASGSQSPDIKKMQADIQDYNRPQTLTYLTYPAWYTVFSATEYARYTKDNLPSGFPFFSAIEQYWFGFCTMYRVTNHQDELGLAHHLKLMLVGVGFSSTYALEGLYENTVGMLSEWSSSYKQVPEDLYASSIAHDYADFIHYHPWYEFSYMNSLSGLWKDTDLYGPHVVRKWERKIILSAQYIVKSAYASLIGMASSTVYGTGSSRTYFLMKNVPDYAFTSAFKNDVKIQMVKKVNNNEYIASLPHGQSFTDIIPILASDNVQFEDIAGNKMILITVIVPQGWSYTFNEGTILFTMDLLSRPDEQRVVIEAPVTQLSDLLVQITNSGAEVEHIYDY